MRSLPFGTGILTTADAVKAHLLDLANPATAAILQRFFKTAPGQYGAGDLFHGIKVPVLRQAAKRFVALPLDQVQVLLDSPIHEERLVALVILCLRFPKADAAQRKAIYRLYLANTARINNWDLVDVSAEHVVGAYLADKDRTPLLRLAKSKVLWERRIAIVATFHFLRRGELGPTLEIAERLVNDAHDLIHKAVGWLLREVGKRDRAALEAFLARHCATMPRTALRYAIERFDPPTRRRYLEGQLAATTAAATAAPLPSARRTRARGSRGSPSGDKS